jgi:dihydrodipicolinate synthase/N-acetylneuraminate lyase
MSDPLNAVLFVESNPSPVKAALAQFDRCQDNVRLSLARATRARKQTLPAAPPPAMRAEQHAAQRPAISPVG